LRATELATVLDDWLTELAAEGHFSGSVRLATADQALLRSGYGFANVAFEAACTPDTRFNIGSINKSFTAWMVTQLVEDGRVDLDAPLSDYLPSFANAAAATRTVRQLLQHTAGLSDFLALTPSSELARADTVSELCMLIRSQPVAPAGEFSYSNSGFILLGGLIEAVTESSYYDELQTRVFDPLAMSSSGHTSLDRVVPRLATGYFAGDDGALRANTRLLLERTPFDGHCGGPAGGGYSTVDDLGRFARSLLGDPADGPLFTYALQDAVPMKDEPARYAYGLMEFQTEGSRSFGHTGGYAGINALFEVFPERGLVFVLLANHEGAVTLIAPRVRELIARMHVD